MTKAHERALDQFMKQQLMAVAVCPIAAFFVALLVLPLFSTSGAVLGEMVCFIASLPIGYIAPRRFPGGRHFAPWAWLAPLIICVIILISDSQHFGFNQALGSFVY